MERASSSKFEDAAIEVRKPTMFGELIIMIVYLPILTLEGVEGKLFRPMAMTVIFALAGSMLLSLTLMPVLASLILPKRMKGTRTAARAVCEVGIPSNSTLHHAPQVGGNWVCPLRANHLFWNDCPTPWF